MASLATNIRGAAPTSVDTRASKKVKEHSVRDALSLRLGGSIEVLTSTGCTSLVVVDSTGTKCAKRETSGVTESELCSKKAKKAPRATRHTYACDKVPLLLKINCSA